MHQRFENIVTALFLLVLGAGLLLHGGIPWMPPAVDRRRQRLSASVVGSARCCPHRPKTDGAITPILAGSFLWRPSPAPFGSSPAFPTRKKKAGISPQSSGPGPFVSRSEELAEVKATGYVLHTHDIRHMGGMPAQHLRRLLLRIGVDKSMVDVHPPPHHRCPGWPGLIVRQVPPDIAQSAAVG